MVIPSATLILIKSLKMFCKLIFGSYNKGEARDSINTL